MNLSNPLTSTFRIRPGTLLHDDKREKYFYDMILPLILVYQIWGIGVSTFAPAGPEKHSQWGHHRAFGAGSTMDRSNSWLIGISSEIISCGTPRRTAIHEVCPWEPAQSVAECRRRASCSRASKTAASALFCLCWPSLLMFCGMRLFMLLCIIGLALLTFFLKRNFTQKHQKSKMKRTSYFTCRFYGFLAKCHFCEVTDYRLNN